VQEVGKVATKQDNIAYSKREVLPSGCVCMYTHHSLTHNTKYKFAIFYSNTCVTFATHYSYFLSEPICGCC